MSELFQKGNMNKPNTTPTGSCWVLDWKPMNPKQKGQ